MGGQFNNSDTAIYVGQLVSTLTVLRNFKFFHLCLIQTESSYRCQTNDNKGDQKQMERPSDERYAINDRNKWKQKTHSHGSDGG